MFRTDLKLRKAVIVSSVGGVLGGALLVNPRAARAIMATTASILGNTAEMAVLTATIAANTTRMTADIGTITRMARRALIEEGSSEETSSSLQNPETAEFD